MKKVLLNIIIIIWAIVAIITTVSLLSMNDYRVTELAGYSFIALDTDDLEPEYEQGALMIVEKSSNDDIVANDDIFYYNANNQDAIVNHGTVLTKTNVDENETTFTMEGQQSVSSEYVIGKVDSAKTINTLGYIITILQSQWGFMFIIIFPSIFMVIYEVYNIVVEVKRNDKKEE